MNIDNEQIIFQFSHPDFWGYQVKFSYEDFLQALLMVENVDDLIQICVDDMIDFFKEHNLMCLKERIEGEKELYHIHTGTDDINQIIYFITTEKLKYTHPIVLELFQNMKTIYICNKKYCPE